MVKYCTRDCQIAHRRKHKNVCKKRAAELYDEKLFKEPPPPEECPICMLPPPLYGANHSGMTFFSCCGKLICDGCEYAMEESGAKDLCPFCKSLPPISDEESVKRVKKMMEKGNGEAFFILAWYYAQGIEGMPQDIAKANELYLKAGELGCATGYFNLGQAYYHGRGAEIDKKKAKHYLELAAMNGDVMARANLGANEYEAGNYDRAFKHFLLGARAGDKVSLENVKKGYMHGQVSKDEYANALRQYQKSQDEMKSDARDEALAARN